MSREKVVFITDDFSFEICGKCRVIFRQSYVFVSYDL